MRLLKDVEDTDSANVMKVPWRMYPGARALLYGAISIQAVHIALHLSIALPSASSDFLQGVASSTSAAVCLYKYNQEKKYQRLWLQLATGFGIWTVAQFYWTFAALQPGVTEVGFSNLLWLIYAFPMLLVTLYRPQTSQQDLAGWFDGAQACIFFSVLIALFFPPPGIISQAISDDVQGVALLLALILRYSITAPGQDRIFFRNLTIYMAVYVALCFVYYAATNHGFQVGSIIELCWTIPFTLFSVLAICTDLSEDKEEAEWSDVSSLTRASYIQGISALGLAVLSLTASAVLAYHKPRIGGAALAVTFVLFASRTIAREWQLHSLHARLNHSVLHDSLTSVANRTLLQAEITRRLKQTTLVPHSTTVLFVGLDRFKTLNDCLGHAFGDLLLQRVADILSRSVRKQDLVARYGGDEFVILLDKANSGDAEAFADRILELLRQPQYLEGRVLYLTVSIGLTAGTKDADAAAMLQDAHFAMHHAKRAGKDRRTTFEPEMVRGPLYRLGLESDLREALFADEMTVFYQPIFSVKDGMVRGFEALARWTHKDRGNVSPADFIPVAEDTGMILELGAQILRKACKQCREWNEQFGAEYTMNVNVSAHQFASPHIFELIVTTLRETRLEPRLLKLEITESVLLSGHSLVKETLVKAQRLGVQICLDDFGTGYSSLSYLLNYPFDVVKIDQSFVRHLDKDPRRADVVRLLVDLAESLNKQLVAEGVERTEEMDCLREFGCEFMQGYLPSRPLSVEAATVLLTAQNRRERIRAQVEEPAA